MPALRPHKCGGRGCAIYASEALSKVEDGGDPYRSNVIALRPSDDGTLAAEVRKRAQEYEVQRAEREVGVYKILGGAILSAAEEGKTSGVIRTAALATRNEDDFNRDLWRRLCVRLRRDGVRARVQGKVFWWLWLFLPFSAPAVVMMLVVKQRAKIVWRLSDGNRSAP